MAATIASPSEAESPEVSAQETSDAFNSAAAWDEFEGQLRARYAYIERADLDVDAQLLRSKAIALSAPDSSVFRRIIHQTALTFMDPHLIIGPFTPSDYAIVMTAADLDAKFFNGKAVIADVRRGSPAFEAGLRPGDMLTFIDGLVPEAAAMAPFGKVLPQPTAAQMDYGLTLAVNGKRGFARVLEVMGADGLSRRVKLISTRDYARSQSDRPTVAVERIGEAGKVVVITPLNSLGNNDTIAAFDRAMIEAADANAIVLDMRETPSGGNTEVARSIIGHFVTEAKPYQMHRIPALEREFSVPRQFVEYVMPREPYFAGPVFVLHGKWTGSMGEGIVIGMDAASNAVSIGSDMGDLLGGLWNVDLPLSGARMDLGGEALFHVNGLPREDYVADIAIMPASTASDGSDPAIAAVLEIMAKQAAQAPTQGE
ncbi:MAG: hypothetical protein ABJ063_09955 [Marinomonas sp.]